LSLLIFSGSPSSSAGSPADSLCGDIRAAWESIEGNPYVWGGSRPEDGGYDCSGAIYRVQRLIGKPVPRTTAAKYFILAGGEEAHWSEAGCGYWIWWTLQPHRPYGHVGMHVEQPMVWQSGSSTGPVEIKMWGGGYWDRSFEASKSMEKNQ
jgi:cell wall-associated NlpC family hydrolase